MNDKELFWSIISPHLVDRPDVSNRATRSLTQSLEHHNWSLLRKFTIQNHKFVLPDDLVWRDDFDKVSAHNHDILPLSRYSNKLIFVRGKHPNDTKILGLNIVLPNHRIETALTPMHHSETEYVMGWMTIHTDDSGPVYAQNTMEYAVYDIGSKFINWRGNPFDSKSVVMSAEDWSDYGWSEKPDYWTPKEQYDAFIDRLKEIYPEYINYIYQDSFETPHGSFTMQYHLEDYGSIVVLEWLEVSNKGRGHGSEILTNINKVADETNIELYLDYHVDIANNDRWSRWRQRKSAERREQFYKRYGFVIVNYPKDMVRKPRMLK